MNEEEMREKFTQLAAALGADDETRCYPLALALLQEVALDIKRIAGAVAVLEQRSGIV